MNNRVNLRIDFAFKQLFGTKGNEEILMEFLNAILQKAIAMEQDETLQQAIQKWDNMSHNQKFRREYEAREKVLLDEKAAVAHAEKKGIEKGREEGEARIIRKLYENGMIPQDIANHLEMHIAEVQRILQLS